MPIFDAGRIHADVRAAWSQYRQAVLARSLRLRLVTEQVRRAYADVTASGQRLEDLRTEVAAAERAYRIASDSYDQGLATSLDRLDAQDRLLSAQLQLSAEELDAKIYHLTLLRTLAGLNDVFKPSIESSR